MACLSIGEVMKISYKPTKFMAGDSHYDKKKADYAVNFIQCLTHTKGAWSGKKFTLLPWQEQIIRDIFGVVKPDGYRQFNTAYIEIPKKNGKELALDTPIPTPGGWSTMGDLKVGDMVFDERGKPCYVVAKSQVDDKEQAYRLTFRDGSTIVAGENHLWDVEDIYGAKPKRCIYKTKDIYARTMQKRIRNEGNPAEAMRSVIRIPVTAPVCTKEQQLPFDPYLYGYWLGNGTATEKCITVRTEDIEAVRRLIPYECLRVYNQGGSSRIYYNELKLVLLNSYKDKEIRTDYLRASINQRWRLLQGLMDSDGCVSETKSQSIYVTTVKRLAETVCELLWSLGIKNAMTETPSTRNGTPTGETLYQIRFTTFEDQPTSGLDRKIARSRERVKHTRSCFHYLRDIEPLPYPVQMQCIQVSSTSHCYLAGKSMIPTHNSELAAAVSLLLTCGDLEERAEVYGCAADRQQASIVFDVAADMVDMCPALAKRCKVLRSTRRLIYLPTNSFYQVLSADVSNKHGFNTHGVIFDELHVQPNRKLYDVMTKGSGDARTQPLFFLITTAGTDTHSVCYEQHEKSKNIMAGKIIDPTYYPCIYGADESDDWTSEETWYKANPSLGITVGIDKVRDACESAKQNPAEENTFRQLRLNQWVKQEVRWMPMHLWDECDFPTGEEMLRGRICYGGLDLSSSGDITAFVLVFPPLYEEDKFHVLPYFWIPEDNLELRVRRDHVPYDTWHKKGYVETTEGNVIHYSYIEQFIEELGKKFNIREIAYDRWGATQLSQDLEEAGFSVIPFGQGFSSMSPPTKELYRLVLEQRIAHGGNPVLRWMMDNVVVKTDPAGNIKMDKSKSTEKIDGAVAMVMALDRAIRCGNSMAGSIYDDDDLRPGGLLFI